MDKFEDNFGTSARSFAKKTDFVFSQDGLGANNATVLRYDVSGNSRDLACDWPRTLAHSRFFL